MGVIEQPTFRRVYVWQLPVRLYHWVNAVCVLALIVTGYLIGNQGGDRDRDEPHAALSKLSALAAPQRDFDHAAHSRRNPSRCAMPPPRCKSENQRQSDLREQTQC